MLSKTDIEKMSSDEVFAMEKKLQQDSDVMLKEYDVINILSKYGVPQIKGSKSLDVMCTKNIDIFLETRNNLMEIWFELCETFLKTKGIRRIHPINYYDYDRDSNYLEDGNKGFGYFISFSNLKSNQVDNSKEWDFEISIINGSQNNETVRLISTWDETIDEEKRLSILKIKMFISPISEELKKSGNGKIKSIEIYKAVLEDGVKSIDEFISWYEKNETNVERLAAFHKILAEKS